MLSFKRACMSAKPSAFDSTLGEKMAEISMSALKKAATLANLGKQVGSVAGRLIESLKGTSCLSGYSNNQQNLIVVNTGLYAIILDFPWYFSQSRRVTAQIVCRCR